LKTIMRLTLVAALLLISAVPAAAQSANPAVRGSLIIVGGGSQPDAVRQRFIELAGGTQRARILVIPLAGANAEETGRSSAAVFTRLGVQARSLVVNRAQADSDSALRALDGITGVWFPGGVQTRITDALRGTRLQRALQELYQNGAVLGGTSAGAAIMSDSMLTGSQYPPGVDTAVYTEDSYTRIARRSIELVPGLGFLPGAIVDQHFVRRERHNRLLSVILERPHLIGAGIDEQTAIEVRPDGTWHILGNSVVLIYDARQGQVTGPEANVLAARDVRMHVISAGGSFNPRTGAALLRARQ
jgi:cyanophycinase